MSRYRPLMLILTLFLALGVLAACQPAATEPEVPPTPTATDEGEETPVSEPTDTPPAAGEEGLPPAAVLEAQQALIESLGINREQIETINFEQREWPDACLGLADEGEMCAQVITPGFLVTLEAAGERYHVRSNLEATSIRIEEMADTQAQQPETLPPPVETARRQLAEALSTGAERIEILSYEPTDWPNACLGMAEAGEMCAEVITPGHLIMARVAGTVYEIHSAAGGSTIRYRAMSETNVDLPGAAAAARQALAERLDMDESAVEVVSFERQEWRNSCLGLGRPDESCLQAITPGYRVLLAAGGRTYEARTNESGSNVRFASSITPREGITE